MTGKRSEDNRTGHDGLHDAPLSGNTGRRKAKRNNPYICTPDQHTFCAVIVIISSLVGILYLAFYGNTMKERKNEPLKAAIASGYTFYIDGQDGEADASSINFDHAICRIDHTSKTVYAIIR